MKKIFTLLFCVFFLDQFAQSDKQILEFTKANYLKLVGQMPENKMADFGFANKDEIYSLSFTKVFAEYIFMNGAFVKSNNYRVLAVNDKGKTRGLFTVWVDKDEMVVADYGASELARILNCSVSSFDKDAHLSILRVMNLQSDYLFDDLSKAPDKKYLKLFENNFYTATEIHHSSNQVKTN